MKSTVIILILIVNFGFTQTIKVNLDKYGDSKFAGFKNNNYALPLYPRKKNKYYAKLPVSIFEDTLELLVTKKKNSYFPQKIECLNQTEDSWIFIYNKEDHLVTITDGNLKKESHLYNLNKREGKTIMVSSVKDELNADTSVWLGIERKMAKYGELSINDKTYTITVAGLNIKTPENKDISVISIDTSLSMYRGLVKNARCNSISSTKYLDFEGVFFRIKNIDPDGNFIEIEKCDKIVPDSCIYYDTYLRAFNYKYEGSDFDIRELLKEGKYVVLNVWTEYCPPCIRSIPLLNELHEKYKNKAIILSLFVGQQKDLSRMEADFNITYPVGILSEEIKKDILVYGYPYKAIISPDGKIIELGFRGVDKLEDFLENLK